MKNNSSKTRWLAIAAGIVLGLMIRSGAVAAPDNPQCTCWYDGFDDGSEFPPEKIREAEHYAACAKQGNQSPFEAGFNAVHSGKERKCPL